MSNKPNLFIIYCQLMKLRVVILLQITAICAILGHDLMVRSGELEGHRTWYDTIYACVITLFGGTLAAGGANAINMVWDRDIDVGMSRTRSRPIPKGWISPRHATIFGIFTSIGGSAIFLDIHWKAAFWSIFSVIYYVFIYTIWLKRITPQNIVIGGVAGSTPPLIGWICASASIDYFPNDLNPLNLGSPVPWMLFLLIFLWTPPHFWALAILMKDDYSKAKIPMLPSVVGIDATFKPMMLHTITLVLLTLTMAFIDDKLGLIYLISCSIIGIYYIYITFKISKEYTREQNLKVYKFSLLYMMLFSFIVIADSLI